MMRSHAPRRALETIGQVGGLEALTSMVEGLRSRLPPLYLTHRTIISRSATIHSCMPWSQDYLHGISKSCRLLGKVQTITTIIITLFHHHPSYSLSYRRSFYLLLRHTCIPTTCGFLGKEHTIDHGHHKPSSIVITATIHPPM